MKHRRIRNLATGATASFRPRIESQLGRRARSREPNRQWYAVIGIAMGVGELFRVMLEDLYHRGPEGLRRANAF